MRRLLVPLVMVVLVASLSASVALAATRINRLSFSAVGSFGSTSTEISGRQLARHGGDEGDDLCKGKCIGEALQADGSLLELDPKKSARVVLKAVGVPADRCRDSDSASANRGWSGGGHSSNTVTVVGEQVIEKGQISRKGKADIAIVAKQEHNKWSKSSSGCRGSHGGAESVQFTEATITVYQDGVKVLRETFTFND